jgi:hypothetical protein
MILIPPSIENCISACWIGATSVPSDLLSSCPPTESNIFWDFFRHCPERTCPIQTSNIARTKSHIYFPSLRSFIQEIRPGPRLLVIFCNELIFLRWGVVSHTPNPQAGGPPLVGCPPLLIRYIRSYRPYLEAVSSIRNLRKRHAVVTTDPPNMAIPAPVPVDIIKRKLTFNLVKFGVCIVALMREIWNSWCRYSRHLFLHLGNISDSRRHHWPSLLFVLDHWLLKETC